MANPSIADLLKYADLQMAAEAFLTVLPIDGSALKSGQELLDALITGNGHASKFTETQAKNFLAHWTVVAQQPNTSTGFSGTLFRWICSRLIKVHSFPPRSEIHA